MRNEVENETITPTTNAVRETTVQIEWGWGCNRNVETYSRLHNRTKSTSSMNIKTEPMIYRVGMRADGCGVK